MPLFSKALIMPLVSKNKSLKGASLEVIMDLNDIGGKRGPKANWFLIDEKHGRVVNLSKKGKKASKGSEAKEATHKTKNAKEDGKAKHDKKEEEKGSKNEAKKSEPTKDEANKPKVEPKAAEPEKPTGSPKDTSGQQSGQDAPAFTPEQDAKLMEMKLGDKTWKEIVEAVGRSKRACQDRWKQIKPEEGAAQPAQENAAKGENNNGKQGGQVLPADQNLNVPKTSNPGVPKEAVRKLEMPGYTDLFPLRSGRPMAPPTLVSNRSIPYTTGWGNRYGNNRLPEEREWADLLHSDKCDDDEKYQRLASRYYDRTGKRMHPDDIRDAIRASKGRH